MNKLAWSFIVALAVLHYDFWYWADTTLVFGFMPVGLLYQAMISVLAALGWFMVVKFSWPTAMEEWADESPEQVDGVSSQKEGA